MEALLWIIALVIGIWACDHKARKEFDDPIVRIGLFFVVWIALFVIRLAVLTIE